MVKAEGFSEEDKIKVLLWSARHCCVCDKSCGLDIEIAHIDHKRKKGKNEIDNAKLFRKRNKLYSQICLIELYYLIIQKNLNIQQYPI